MPYPKQFTDEEALEAYDRLGSFKKAAAALGVCPQSVHERVQKLGRSRPVNVLSESDADLIRNYYAATPPEDFDLDDLAKIVGRPRTLVCRYAGLMGLTNRRRPMAKETRENMRVARKGQWSVKRHPRGMAGKKHTADTLDILSLRSRAKWDKAKATGTGLMSERVRQARSNHMVRRRQEQPEETPYSRAKAGRREDIGKWYFRSAWEANYARYLNFLQARGHIDSWDYECEVFWFEKIRRGVRSYLPDFKVWEKGATYFVEVKGWMDAKSKTKLRRMKKYHPRIEIHLVGPRQYREIENKLGRLIVGWEWPTKTPRDVLIKPWAKR